MRGRPWAGKHRIAALMLLCIVVPLLAACSNTPGPEANATQNSCSFCNACGNTYICTGNRSTCAHSYSARGRGDNTSRNSETLDGGASHCDQRACTADAEPATTETPEEAIRPLFGVVTHLYYTDRERVLQLAQNAGFEWIRQQVPWKDTQRQIGPSASMSSIRLSRAPRSMGRSCS